MNFGLLILRTLNEGTNSLVTSELGWKRWLIMGCHTVDTIKLTMAGTQEWWCQFTPLLVYSYILYSKNVLGLSGSFYGGLVTASANF